MAFGDVRKCPVCPAYWIEDNQMYEDPNVCPACGVDAGDVMRNFKRSGLGNVSRELVLNGGVEYFTGVIDDGKSNTFENWTNAYVNDAANKKIEAVSDCYKGGAAVRLMAATGTVRFTQEITHELALEGGDFRYSFWTKGDGDDGNVQMQLYPYGGGGYFTLQTQLTQAVWTRFQGTVTIDTDNNFIRYRFAVAGTSTPYCYVDEISLRKILTD